MKKRGLGVSVVGERNGKRFEKFAHGIKYKETEGKAVLRQREYRVSARECTPYREVGLEAW